MITVDVGGLVTTTIRKAEKGVTCDTCGRHLIFGEAALVDVTHTGGVWCGRECFALDGAAGRIRDEREEMHYNTPRAGSHVCWQSTFDGWRTGRFVGLAPGDNGSKGDPFVAVDASNGRVHVRLSALTW